MHGKSQYTAKMKKIQPTACCDEDNGFVAPKTAIAELTAEQAMWKSDGADNTIWEEVNHLIFWNERWLQRYRGELNEPQDVENNGTFKSYETDWQATCEKRNEITDEKLESPVNAQYQLPLAFAARAAKHP